ncbi:MAG: DUF1343 domain-containing protein [Chitinophagaceae bacterium]|nr:DUF1343 domain-containing protein [Chitinophagaceae bacterium]MCB9046346.1 DUF1343 domain-containing protein [Chitinophagales bacterium]
MNGGKLLMIVMMPVFFVLNTYAQRNEGQQPVITGAEQMDMYLPQLEGKRVALLINQTSVVGSGKTLLPDTLLKRGINIVKILAPEHGFRGKAEAGEKVDDSKDEKTGLPIISLYGKNKKPTQEQLQDVDIVVYDIQDVGARFYTYISTMQYAMEACAAYGKQFMILDRPNPNGFFVAGPVLDKSLKSFVGMQPIPVVYGMTPGEYAKMLVGEKWFDGADKLKLTVISCKNYDHTTRYKLPVNPSPNLRSMAAVYCYPSLCLFEGTDVSVGRGTKTPFQQFGHPAFKGKAMYGFMPNIADEGPDPLYAAKTCYGMMIALTDEDAEKAIAGKFTVSFLKRAYDWHDNKDKFFNSFFENLAGTKELRKQIQQGWSVEDIEKSWDKDLAAFKQIRKKYLLYKDF